MFKLFTSIIWFNMCIISCSDSEKNDAEKMAMTAKMHEKVKKISAELKAYCDSETYRKARWIADSTLAKKTAKQK